MKKIGLALLFIVLGLACSEQRQYANPQNNVTENYFNFISSLQLPSELNFCGEKVPLDVPEVRERAEREFYLTLQQPGQVILYLKRAGRYFPMFERIIKENNMPDDLKFIAVAESALFMARSSKDAVGMWQFIEGTGRKMGLRIDTFVDERRHPEKSTLAALNYLKQGYNIHKSWLLAAAGYNMGHTGVISNLDFQGTDNYFELFLNEETSRYILRIIIIKEIMTNPEKYGFKISKNDIYTESKVKLIECKVAIPNLAEWAKANGTTYKYVKLLNPWILGKNLPAPTKNDFYKIAVPDS
ncbi:MAG: lytic transglycosylase domain-containing protein [Bacteroidota bacterium]